MKFDNGNWEQVGDAGFSAGGAYYTSLAFDSNNIPYVAYTDDGNSYKASVMKFDNGNWKQVGDVGFSAGVASYTSLAFDSNNIPYVAYMDGGNSNKASVMKLISCDINTNTTDCTNSSEINIVMSDSTGTASFYDGTKTLKLKPTQKLNLSSSLTTDPSSTQNLVTIKTNLNNATNTKGVKLRSGLTSENITFQSNTINHTVEFEDETTFYANDTWDGLLNPPTDASGTSAPNGFTINGAVSVGSSTEKIILDKPAKITLVDKATSETFQYKSPGDIDWTEMSECSDATTSSAGSLVFPNECYLISGNDAIIWTYR